MKTSSHHDDSLSAAESISTELDLPRRNVVAAVELLQGGNTIPFIARYRKEATRGLDEIALRAIEDALERLNALETRRRTVLKTISELGCLTEELRLQIENCSRLQSLEAIYQPFKPKRRTRATIAREQGLQPLASILLRQQTGSGTRNEILEAHVNPGKGVADCDAALKGALDIVAEQWSDEVATREWMVAQAMSNGSVVSRVKRGKREAAGNYELYIDHEESVRQVPSHRLLAMLRGESEGILRVGLGMDESRALPALKRKLVFNREFQFCRDLLLAVEDCYRRLLMPATESAVFQALKEKADDEAINVFGKNLKELLMAAPAGPRVTIGIDPGFRSGCKVAVVDGTGKFLEHTTIYPTPPRNDTDRAKLELLKLIERHQVELVAIGNGTASRETDAFVKGLIRENRLDITGVVVSESGASIYSASEVAIKEFPDLDITVRGAISIARRLQDPLAELVKSDPKSIGVGQYQHDVNQRKLRKCVDRVVESCVNSVGVDLNTASVSLLSHVAGIGLGLAGNIVAHRNTNGRYTNRKQLMSVTKLGKTSFEQAAGFLRIRGGDQPLDNSAVHPESYVVVNRMAEKVGADTDALVANPALSRKLIPEEFVDERFGTPTIVDIIAELGKPGRDPRSEFRIAKFNEAINNLEDLRPGMILEGVVTNVTHFGAFIDIGVHQDALIHISQLADEFVKDPNEVVSVGDVVKIKVLEIDIARKRISATKRFRT